MLDTTLAEKKRGKGACNSQQHVSLAHFYFAVGTSRDSLQSSAHNATLSMLYDSRIQTLQRMYQSI